MKPSESAIETAIDGLPAGSFQTLAEAYARVELSPRFDHLVPRGRTSKHHARAGWPDAYAPVPHGFIDVVEATRDVRNWRDHLRADVQHIVDAVPTRVSGFVFVCWAREPGPDAVRQWQSEIEDAGVPANRVHLAFREGLIARLREPRHALCWTEVLGLPTSVLPFQELRRAPIFGSVGDEGLFAPTLDEYVAGDVQAPAAFSTVRDALEERNIALVRGRGAAGKTVLAALFGLSGERVGAPAYYLDLAASMPALQREALEAITTRADRNVLFIVDNVHQDESFAHSLVGHWERVGRGSRLLLVGRAMASNTSPSRGVVAPLGLLEAEAVPLEVATRDLAGVYTRLARRRSRAAPPPKEPVLREVVRDLVEL